MYQQPQTTLLLFGALCSGAGFVLGLFCNIRKVIRLEDKVTRLKRTIRHLQARLSASHLPDGFPLHGEGTTASSQPLGNRRRRA